MAWGCDHTRKWLCCIPWCFVCLCAHGGLLSHQQRGILNAAALVFQKPVLGSLWDIKKNDIFRHYNSRVAATFFNTSPLPTVLPRLMFIQRWSGEIRPLSGEKKKVLSHACVLLSWICCTVLNTAKRKCGVCQAFDARLNGARPVCSTVSSLFSSLFSVHIFLPLRRYGLLRRQQSCPEL